MLQGNTIEVEKLVEENCQELIESYIQWHGR
jgi:hypothetical protein